MSLESELKKLNANLEVIMPALVALTAAAPVVVDTSKAEAAAEEPPKKTRKAKPTPEPEAAAEEPPVEEPEEPQIDKESLRQRIIAYVRIYGRDAGQDLLRKSGGAEKLDQVDPVDYQAVWDAFEPGQPEEEAA